MVKFLFITFIYGLCFTVQGKVLKIKVANNLDKFTVMGLDVVKDFHPTGKRKFYKGKKLFKFNCSSLNRKIEGDPIKLVSLKSNAGIFAVGDNVFKGDLHVISSPGARACDVVQETQMDEYIAGLLSKELNALWPIEVLKAQAVAARTYALYKAETQQESLLLGREAYYDVENSERHQVGGSYLDATASTREAATSTMGEILVGPDDSIIPVFFHSKCGGMTLRPEEVWQNQVKGYRTVNCPYCHETGTRPWNKRVTWQQIQLFAKWLIRKGVIKEDTSLRSLYIADDHKFNKNIILKLNNKLYRVKKALFRRYFGGKMFPSNRFSVVNYGSYWQIKGTGLGHGVGMCQIGALQMAKRGWNYRRILAHYFPKFKLKKVW